MREVGYHLNVAALGGGLLLGAGLAVGQLILNPAAKAVAEQHGDGAWLLLWSCALVAVVAAVGHRVLVVWATPAELTWRDLDPLLSRRSRWRIPAWVAVVLAPTGMALAASEWRPDPWVVATPALAALGGGLAVLLPHLDRSHLVTRLQAAAGLAGVGLLAWWSGWPALAVLMVVAVTALVLARDGPSGSRSGRPGWYPTPPRWELARAGRLVQAWWSAAVMLDSAPLALERERSAPGRRRSLAGSSTLGLVVARMLSTRSCLTATMALPLPAGATSVWGSRLGEVLLMGVTYVFASAVTPVLDAYLDHESLRRTYAHRAGFGRDLVVATTLPVAGFAGVAGLLAGLGLPVILAALLVAALGWVRRATGRSLAGQVGELMTTPAGAVPVDLANRAVAGPDVLLLGCVVVWSASTPIAVMVLALLLVHLAAGLWRRVGR